MDVIRERLEQDLANTVGRLRQMESAVALDDLPSIGAADGFEYDEIQELERREIGFATRDLLVARVLRLQAALDRLRDGEYGICVECEEAINPRRLQALPEVQTCVRCQDRLERLGRRLQAAEVEAGDLDDED
jgi:DnaK suppressor protein